MCGDHGGFVMGLRLQVFADGVLTATTAPVSYFELIIQNRTPKKGRGRAVELAASPLVFPAPILVLSASALPPVR